MSDGLRRIVCRVTFVVFGLFPTLVVVNWALFPRTPAEWQAALQAQVGLLLRIEHVVTETPFQTRFEQVQVADLQRRLLAIVPTIRWSHEPTAHVIELGTCEVSRDELTRGCRQLLAVAANVAVPVTLTTDALHVVDGASGAACSLHHLQIQLQPAGDGVLGSVTFQMDPNLPGLVRWDFQTSAAGMESAPAWQLDTAGQEIPAWLLAGELNELAAWGSQAAFRGQIQAYDEPAGRVHQVTNLQIRQLDLLTSFGQPLGLAATGLLDVDVGTARFVAGRVETLVAIATCHHGKLPRRLLTACSQWLGWQVAAGGAELLDISNLAVAIELQNQQVTIRAPQPGLALVSEAGTGQPLAVAANSPQPLPVHVLACCLAKENAYAVPADPQVQRMLQYLPLGAVEQ